jgi:hypothetical protein
LFRTDLVSERRRLRMYVSGYLPVFQSMSSHHIPVFRGAGDVADVFEGAVGVPEGECGVVGGEGYADA